MVKPEEEKKKSEDPKKTLTNIIMLFTGNNDAVKFVDDYSSMILVAKRKASERKGLKILAPKQMFQRLTIALAQL